jgi:hypothetical protein
VLPIPRVEVDIIEASIRSKRLETTFDCRIVRG